MTPKPLLWLTLALAAIVLMSSACGAGDDDSADATFSAQPVNCAAMERESYRFVTTITFKVDAPPTPTPEGVAPAPPPFELTQKIEGDVESSDAYQATMSFIDGLNRSQTVAMRKGDKWWLQNTSGWSEEVTEVIPYRPVSICESIAPDIDSTGEHTADTVNGIASARFDYTDWATTWADRSPDFGGGSDVGSLIETFTGSVWIANAGNYISKLQLEGQGAYPNGSVLHISISYEVSDRGAKIEIDEPV